MVGYQAFDKDSAQQSKAAGKPMMAYNPDARANVGQKPVATRSGTAKGPKANSVNGVSVRTGQAGLVAVGVYKVNPKTGTVTYQKPPTPKLKAASSPSGDIKTGPQGKNGSPGRGSFLGIESTAVFKSPVQTLEPEPRWNGQRKVHGSAGNGM